MWTIIPQRTPHYRVTRETDQWGDVTLGLGAFYTDGARYNRVHQRTIYASFDPLVALSEFAWHQSLALCGQLGTPTALPYPLRTAGKLWRFELDSALVCADLDDPICATRFAYPAHAVVNPHPTQYEACRKIADRIRGTKNSHGPTEGLIATSLRVPHEPKKYKPRSVVLFVLQDPNVVPQSIQNRATLIDRWQIDLEFKACPLRTTAHEIDSYLGWLEPEIVMSGSNVVPKYAKNPDGKSLRPGMNYRLKSCYSPY